MKVTASEEDLLKSKTQNPQYKIEIYDSDDDLIQELTDIESFSVEMVEDRFTRRTFSLSVNNDSKEYTFLQESKSNNLYWYDKTIKIYAKVE